MPYAFGALRLFAPGPLHRLALAGSGCAWLVRRRVQPAWRSCPRLACADLPPAPFGPALRFVGCKRKAHHLVCASAAWRRGRGRPPQFEGRAVCSAGSRVCIHKASRRPAEVPQPLKNLPVDRHAAAAAHGSCASLKTSVCRARQRTIMLSVSVKQGHANMQATTAGVPQVRCGKCSRRTVYSPCPNQRLLTMLAGPPTRVPPSARPYSKAPLSGQQQQHCQRSTVALVSSAAVSHRCSTTPFA